MDDNRIVYGAVCTWWDSIYKVGHREIPKTADPLIQKMGPLPCCPFCKGMLFEINDIEWYSGIQERTKQYRDYAKFMEWCKGKCYRSMKDAVEAYIKIHPDNMILGLGGAW